MNTEFKPSSLEHLMLQSINSTSNFVQWFYKNTFISKQYYNKDCKARLKVSEKMNTMSFVLSFHQWQLNMNLNQSHIPLMFDFNICSA